MLCEILDHTTLYITSLSFSWLVESLENIPVLQPEMPHITEQEPREEEALLQDCRVQILHFPRGTRTLCSDEWTKEPDITEQGFQTQLSWKRTSRH